MLQQIGETVHLLWMIPDWTLNEMYLLDQTLLSNCHCTSRCAKQNSRHSQILTTAKIRVAPVHINKRCSQIVAALE